MGFRACPERSDNQSGDLSDLQGKYSYADPLLCQTPMAHSQMNALSRCPTSADVRIEKDRRNAGRDEAADKRHMPRRFLCHERGDKRTVGKISQCCLSQDPRPICYSWRHSNRGRRGPIPINMKIRTTIDCSNRSKDERNYHHRHHRTRHAIGVLIGGRITVFSSTATPPSKTHPTNQGPPQGARAYLGEFQDARLEAERERSPRPRDKHLGLQE